MGDDKNSLPVGPHFLESEWVLWEHRAPDKNSKSYEDNMAKLCEVATVEDFWRAFNNVPKPSQIFYDGKTRKRFANRSVESFSLFKKGIKPEWEDAANRTGAEWFCRKTFAAQQLDDYWQSLVLGMIGETMDPADQSSSSVEGGKGPKTCGAAEPRRGRGGRRRHEEGTAV